MQQPTTDACVSCGVDVITPYCANCGERRASDRRHTLVGFLQDAFEAVVNVDGRVVRTFKTLVTKPGELTAQFMRGARVPYLAPIQFFLIMNVAFFIWATAVGNRFFDTQLSVHVQGTPYREVAARMVRERIALDSEPEAAYMRRFDTVGTAQAKTLIAAMIPAFALLVAIVAYRRRSHTPAVQHLVFALHTYTFVFVLLFISAYVIDPPLEFALRKLHYPVGRYGYDTQVALVTLMLLGAYIALALRRVYAVGRARSIVAATALGVGFFAILSAYRALLFWVTFKSV